LTVVMKGHARGPVDVESSDVATGPHRGPTPRGRAEMRTARSPLGWIADPMLHLAMVAAAVAALAIWRPWSDRATEGGIDLSKARVVGVAPPAGQPSGRSPGPGGDGQAGPRGPGHAEVL